VRSGDHDRAAVNRALQSTADCLPIERLAETWTAAEHEHVERCPRCQTELALWREFETSTTSADEREAVQQITAALRNRAATAHAAPARAWRWLNLPRIAAVAATVAVVALVGYGLWDPEPKVGVIRHETSPVYRTVHVQPVAPIGDVEAAPRMLQWTPVDGVAGYDVQLLEVDHSVVWRGKTFLSRIELPPDVSARFVPGKTLLWEVAAKNAAGEVVADSGIQQFRVTSGQRPLRDR
jgi:hypothetical protein